MNYILKHFDRPLIRFHATEDSSEPEITILWIDDANRHLLPLDMGEPTEDHISKWLQRRTIPKNRAFVRTFLAKCGISSNRPMSIISVSKGLSLNDSYCVYDDFIGTAASYMSDENREQLRHLLTFKFRKHTRYNLPDHDLSLIERQVRKRAGLLLG